MFFAFATSDLAPVIANASNKVRQQAGGDQLFQAMENFRLPYASSSQAVSNPTPHLLAVLYIRLTEGFFQIIFFPLNHGFLNYHDDEWQQQ